jgi:hypothetical protein
MLTWRIYYGDGSTLSNEDVDPYAVPGLDVQAIVQADPDVGRYVLSHQDFYWWVEADRQWHQGDHFGLWDFLQRPGPKKVVFGRSLDNVSYKTILARAMHDDDGFAPKSGTKPGEFPL